MQWALSAYRMLKVTRVQAKCWIIFPFSLATADWSISITVLLWLTDFSCVYCNLLNCRHIIAKCSRWHCHTMARQWVATNSGKLVTICDNCDNSIADWHDSGEYHTILFALEHKLANQAHVQIASNSCFSCSAPSHGISDVAMLSHVLARGWECLFVSTRHSMHWLHANVMYLPLPSHMFISTGTKATLSTTWSATSEKLQWHLWEEWRRLTKGIAADTWGKCLPLRSIRHQVFLDFSAAQHQAEGISGQACLTAWTRSCRQLQQLAQKRQKEHHVFRERVPWQER